MKAGPALATTAIRVIKQRAPAMIVEQLVAALRDPANRECPSSFPKGPLIAAQPGLYCWYCDAEGGTALGEVLGHPVGPLIYAGLGGEVKSVDRTAKATLLSRIRGMHLSGPLEFSTFRTTLAALLRTPLELSLRKRGYLDAPSDGRLTPAPHARVLNEESSSERGSHPGCMHTCKSRPLHTRIG